MNKVDRILLSLLVGALCAVAVCSHNLRLDNRRMCFIEEHVGMLHAKVMRIAEERAKPLPCSACERLRGELETDLQRLRRELSESLDESFPPQLSKD